MARWLILLLLACAAAWGQSEPSKPNPFRWVPSKPNPFRWVPANPLQDDRPSSRDPDKTPSIVNPGDTSRTTCVIPIPGIYALRGRTTPDDSIVKKVPGANKVDPVERPLPHPICRWTP